jgi:transcriptional regulator with XRE-family HTH domain
MDARLVANYLTALKEKSGLTYETIAEKSKRSESTVKNLCSGKTEDPRLDTVAPVVYAMGGSIDEMYNPNKSKDEVKAISIASIKEIYEQQLLELTKLHEAHVNNIRTHYEQHRQDYKENVEKRFADKREIIAQQEEHIKTLKKENLTSRILTIICVAVLVGLLIAEVMNPNLGWFRFNL